MCLRSILSNTNKRISIRADSHNWLTCQRQKPLVTFSTLAWPYQMLHSLIPLIQTSPPHLLTARRNYTQSQLSQQRKHPRTQTKIRRFSTSPRLATGSARYKSKHQWNLASKNLTHLSKSLRKIDANSSCNNLLTCPWRHQQLVRHQQQYRRWQSWSRVLPPSSISETPTCLAILS